MASEIKYKWNEFHSSIFISTTRELESNCIRFFILRNYEGLPDVNNSKDVDIIIEPGTFKLAKKLFVEVLKRYNVSNYYQMDFERAHCCFGIDIDKEFAIHIDFIEGYLNKGFEFVPFEELYANTIDYKSFRVLNDSYDSCILLMYKLIGSRQLKEKYKEKIYNDFISHGAKCEGVIKMILGDKLGDEVFQYITSRSFEKLLLEAKKINKIAKRRVFFQKPLSTTIGIVKFYWEKFVNMVICPTCKQHFIAVEAPDGTGKTTFIEELRVKISEYFVTDLEKTTIYHFRPTILPNLGVVGEKAGVMKQDTDFTNPHRAKQANLFSSFIRYMYYWIDYVIGVPLIVRKGAQFDHFPIFDRYIYDFIVDPARTRINLPKGIRVLFAHLVKQPRILFILNTDAEIIYKRKQELELDEINRQLREFHLLKNSFNNVYLLDASKKPDQIATDAIRVVVDSFTTKL